MLYKIRIWSSLLAAILVFWSWLLEQITALHPVNGKVYEMADKWNWLFLALLGVNVVSSVADTIIYKKRKPCPDSPPECPRKENSNEL